MSRYLASLAFFCFLHPVYAADLPACIDGMVLHSQGEIILGDRGKILSGGVGAHGDIHIGTGLKGHSNFKAGGDILVANKVKIFGNALAGGKVVLSDGAKVFGAIVEGEALPPCAIFVEPFTAGSQSVLVKSGNSLELQPGDYSDLSVRGQGHLRLTSGIYRFNAFSTEAGGHIHLDAAAGPIRILVKSMELGSRTRMHTSEDTLLHSIEFHSLQASPIALGAGTHFRGALVAPLAEIKVGVGSILRGAFWGGRLVLEPEVKVFHIHVGEGRQVVEIISPPDGYITREYSVGVEWIVDGVSQATLTTEELQVEGANEIIRCAGTECAQISVIRDTQAPVVVITNPGADTTVAESPITVAYTVDGTLQDTIWALSAGENLLVVEAFDAAGNRGVDSLRVRLEALEMLTAVASGPEGVLSYTYFSLDARQSSSPQGTPLQYRWKQIRGEPLVLFHPDRSTTTGLSRGPDIPAFELEVRDALGMLVPALDTVAITVREAAHPEEFLQALQAAQKVQDGPYLMSLTSVGGEGAYFTAEDTLSFSGTVSREDGPFGVIQWFSASASGVFNPQELDWSGLLVPLYEGDNPLTFVYSKGGRVAVERVLVTHSTELEFGEFHLSPDVLEVGRPTDFRVRIPIQGSGINRVILVRWGDFEQELGDLRDDGVGADSLADDGIYSLEFSLTPVSGEDYSLRIKVVGDGGTDYSRIHFFSAQEPFSDAVYNEILQVNSQASFLYDSLTAAIGREAAMNFVADWLIEQPNVIVAGIGPGGRAICWQYASGVHAFISDAPEGTKGGTRKIKVKGLSPFLWEFNEVDNFGVVHEFDDGSVSYKPILGVLNPVAYSVDSLLENRTFSEKNVSIEDWKNWGGYKTIMVSTHGNTFGYQSLSQIRYKPTHDPEKNGSSYWAKPYLSLATGIVLDPLNRPRYWSELNSGGPYPRMVVEASSNTIWLTPTFFTKYNKNLDGSLLYISACRGLYNNGLWDALRANGDDKMAMVGYTEYVLSDFASQAGKVLYKELTQGTELKEAIDSIRAFCSGSGAQYCGVRVGRAHDFSDPVSPAFLEWRGNKDYHLVSTDIYTWGGNRWGQLGNGERDLSKNSENWTPNRIMKKGGLKVAAGISNALLLAADSSIWSWGANHSGQLGFGDTATRTVPTQIPGLDNVIDIFSGSDAHHNLALLADSTLRAWGFNRYGQLGVGHINEFIPVPTAVHGSRKFIQVAPAFSHTLAISADSTLWAWGTEENGSFGDGIERSVTPIPMSVSSMGKVVQVAIGIPYAQYVLKADSTLWAWGTNYAGKVGNGNSDVQFTPVEVLKNVTEISYRDFPVAIRDDSTVWTWGDGEYLGDGVWTRMTPTKVPEITGAVATSSGNQYQLIVTAKGEVWSFGNNNEGMLGDGTEESRSRPVKVKKVTTATSVAAGFDSGVALE